MAITIAFRCTIKDVRWAFQEEMKGSPTAESMATDHRIWPEESKPGVSHGSPLALQPELEFFISRYSLLQPLAEGDQWAMIGPREGGEL